MSASLRETLAANLQWLMDHHDVLTSQSKVAEKAEIDQTTVGRILRVQNPPTVDKLSALAKAFNVEPWQLLTPGLGVDLYRIDEHRRLVPIAAEGPGSWSVEPKAAPEAAPQSPTSSGLQKPSDWSKRLPAAMPPHPPKKRTKGK